MNDRLTPELVLSAYCQGCFPMAAPETGEISFYEPDPRALIPLDNRFHIPHGLKRALNKKPFELRMDTAFPEVVHACARTEQPEEQWIDGQFEEAYGKLHEMGFAHEVASRVIFMDGGAILEENTPSELFDLPQKPRTQTFLSKVL